MKDTELDIFLTEIIEIYGKHVDYPIPEIEWSDCNYYSALGEYQYWKNRIIVNRVLNDSRISKEAVESVVFHEYTHQLYAKHTDKFNAQMDRFPNYYELLDELNVFLDNCEFNESNAINDLPLLVDVETVVANIYYEGDDKEGYENFIGSFDRCAIGSLKNSNLPEEYNNRCIPQVVFTVENNGLVYVVGWAKNVTLFSADQKVDMRQYYDSEPFVYQFKCEIDNSRWLKPFSVFAIEEERLMPVPFNRREICMLSEFSSKTANEIIEEINNYDGEFCTHGLATYAVNEKSYILSNDVDYIRALAVKDVHSRAVWLMNRAIELEPSFENYLLRAEIHEKADDLLLSINDYQKCIELAKKQSIPCGKLNEKLQKLKRAHILFLNN